MIRFANVNPNPQPRFLVENPGEKILDVLLGKMPFPVSEISM
jgi:hypothetical protein